MKTWLLSLAVGGIVIVTLAIAGKLSMARQESAHPSFALDAPAAPAQRSREQAVSIAEHVWGTGILSHPHTESYGSFTDNSLFHSNAPGAHPVGRRDAWEIKVTGLDLARPCAPPHDNQPLHCPPNIHTLVLIVDDKTGTFLEGTGY